MFQPMALLLCGFVCTTAQHACGALQRLHMHMPNAKGFEERAMQGLCLI
jgi:hypothetical protein